MGKYDHPESEEQGCGLCEGGDLGSGNDHTLKHSKTGRPGRWVYVGLTSLLPIYDELEDGAEVLWREYEGVTPKQIASKVKKKNDLEVFDDSEPD